MTPHIPLRHTPAHRSIARRTAAFVVAAAVIGGAPLVAEAADTDGSIGSASIAAPGATSQTSIIDQSWQTTARGQKPVFQPTGESDRPEPEPQSAVEPESAVETESAAEPDLESEPAPESVAESEPAADVDAPREEAVVDPSVAVLTAAYEWDERGDRVTALQELLGVSADGWYGRQTATAHRSALESLELDPAAVPEPVLPPGPSADQWAALRQCEAGGDYSITSASGKYRGAYQFDQSTWNSVAERHAPQLSGVHPAEAAPADQDALALALYRERGANPWPHCGRHLR